MTSATSRQAGPIRFGRSMGFALVRRAPFTLTMIAAITAVVTITGTFNSPIAPALLERWGFGLADLQSGRLLNLLLAPFQILKPYILLTVSSSLFVFGLACEMLWGTRRTALAFGVGHLLGYVGALLILWGLGTAGWGWAAALALHGDVGASNGVFGMAGPPPQAFPGGPDAAWRPC